LEWERSRVSWLKSGSLPPRGEGGRRQSPHSSVETSNDRGAKGGRKVKPDNLHERHHRRYCPSGLIPPEPVMFAALGQRWSIQALSRFGGGVLVAEGPRKRERTASLALVEPRARTPVAPLAVWLAESLDRGLCGWLASLLKARSHRKGAPLGQPSVSPRRVLANWRAGCGKSARPVGREGWRKPMRHPYSIGGQEALRACAFTLKAPRKAVGIKASCPLAPFAPLTP
jgi:hypothetical protein